MKLWQSLWQFQQPGLYWAMLAVPPSSTSRRAVPLAPVLSLAALRHGAGEGDGATVLDAGAARLVGSGRVAIALALCELGVGAGDVVLLPSYHSPSMVPPVTWRGAEPAFYRVDRQARADLDDIAARIDGRTRVVVMTHFFGFPQPAAALRALCDRHGVALLEDCAHAFMGSHEGRPLGAWGDYAAASIMKFLPLYDGGALVSARHPLEGVALRPAGAAFEIKTALNTLERSFAYGRLRALHAGLWLPLRARDLVWGAVKNARRRTGAPAALAPSSSDSGYDFDPAWVDKRMSLGARLVLARTSPRRIAARRRAHYLRLAEAVAGLPGVYPLHAGLGPAVCPWLFPLVAQDPDGLARRLLEAGVPLTRFGSAPPPEQDDGAGKDAAWLARHVLGLPCHQELAEDEVAWLADTLRRAVLA